jgi:hypothetical protein
MGKLEDTFNLPETIQNIEDSAEDIKNYFSEEDDDKFDITSYEQKMEVSMTEFAELDQYSKEMDEIASKTMTEFSDIISLGKDVETRHAGEFFSAAAQMAKISLDAKNNKMTAKLKLLELQLRKQRNDQIEQKQKATIGDDTDDKVDSKSLSHDDLLEIAASLKKS